MTVSAQSAMTDEQVIKFVMKEQKAGSTQQEIAVKLVQKGVTTDQIKRVQKKVERLKKDEGLGAVGDKTLERGRTSAQEQRRPAKGRQPVDPEAEGQEPAAHRCPGRG